MAKSAWHPFLRLTNMVPRVSFSAQYRKRLIDVGLKQTYIGDQILVLGKVGSGVKSGEKSRRFTIVCRQDKLSDKLKQTMQSAGRACKWESRNGSSSKEVPAPTPFHAAIANAPCQKRTFLIFLNLLSMHPSLQQAS